MLVAVVVVAPRTAVAWVRPARPTKPPMPMVATVEAPSVALAPRLVTLSREAADQVVVVERERSAGPKLQAAPMVVTIGITAVAVRAVTQRALLSVMVPTVA